MYSPSSPQAQFPGLSRADALPYLRRVYLLFSGGVAFTIVGALLALYTGEPTQVVSGDATLSIPPMVGFAMQHWIIMMLSFFGAFMVASRVRHARGVNVLALFAFTFITGLFLAPTLFIAQVMASQGTTLDASPVRDAFLLTGGAFAGLSAYVLITRKDFSFLGAALSMGLWVVLGGILLTIFFHAAVFQLAIASAGVLLFCGYILYDTSRILQEREDDAVGAALRLFLDVVNLFTFVLRILSSSRQR